ncbi:MAG: DNA mismatch endonuclease Vsr [Acidobacteriota bacterium]
MTDRITPERRSWNMSRIKGRDTRPEMRVRSVLHGLGLRFTLRNGKLPGRPDIVLPRWRTVILVHGCFWHRHEDCCNNVMPKTRPEFWERKLGENVMRDERNTMALQRLGWRVRVVWECEVADEVKLRRYLQRLFRTAP